MAAVSDLVTDRRVMRHAATLGEAGYDVVCVGRNDLTVRPRRGWRFYAAYNMALVRRLLQECPDVVWANDVDTLPGAWIAARRCKAKLVLDAHELFSEVPEIQHKPVVRWVWRTVERRLIPRCDACLTVCQSIADYYGNRYGVRMTVVRNIPAACTRPKAADGGHTDTTTSGQKTLLYQGSVNVGRGVDWAIDAMEWLPQCRLVVAGNGDLLDAMQARAAQRPWADRIVFLGRVMPDMLEGLTASADVGLVMLEDMGLSYHYALPNRIGDFVAAGVPMVVSDLPEMAAVVRRYPVGEIMTATGARSLADAVQRVLDKGRDAYDFAEARRDMDWNNEKKRLTAVADSLQHHKPSTNDQLPHPAARMDFKLLY